MKSVRDPLLFNEALTKIGGTPAVEKGGDASQKFEVTDEGKEDSKFDEKNSRKMSKGYLAFEMDFVNRS